jgi:hypothetical protein
MPGEELHVIKRQALRPASLSRHSTIRHTSFVVSGLSVSRFVLPSVERNSGRSLFSAVIPAESR